MKAVVAHRRGRELRAPGHRVERGHVDDVVLAEEEGEVVAPCLGAVDVGRQDRERPPPRRARTDEELAELPDAPRTRATDARRADGADVLARSREQGVDRGMRAAHLEEAGDASGVAPVVERVALMP